jgi:hypothetical protein
LLPNGRFLVKQVVWIHRKYRQLHLFSEIYENGGTDNFFLVAALLFVYSQVKGRKKRVERHFPTKAVLVHYFL